MNLFTEEGMKKALRWLIGLYEPDDYEAYDEDEIGEDGGLCLTEVCQALRDKFQTVYQYEVKGTHEYNFNYCGRELFNMRGCLIYSDMEIGVCDIATTDYTTELWLMEDMSFAVVRSVGMQFEKESEQYETCYRVFQRAVESVNDLFFSPEDLLSELEEMCIPQWEHTATVYEL